MNNFGHELIEQHHLSENELLQQQREIINELPPQQQPVIVRPPSTKLPKMILDNDGKCFNIISYNLLINWFILYS